MYHIQKTMETLRYLDRTSRVDGCWNPQGSTFACCRTDNWASYGASSSYAMIFHFSLSLAQSRVKAALCSPGVRKLKSVA